MNEKLKVNFSENEKFVISKIQNFENPVPNFEVDL